MNQLDLARRGPGQGAKRSGLAGRPRAAAGNLTRINCRGRRGISGRSFFATAMRPSFFQPVGQILPEGSADGFHPNPR